ncbi:hypothetical protein FDT66_10385 [Polaribacter aestuariivivens]|uniref:Uncharacterized protein n=1 Tax=Polaribacter aestuariivivens TaxID=2304626 RepID=A0A5S3N2S9_9FLAO|nr:hypothetical protein [Polaribacter aestuariivivens]TMM29523.1 hypothetical protein FDT66_10385 [Polaribacter aestuariivivens]
MNITTNIIYTLFKASILAVVIFWTLLLTEGFINELVLIGAIIPISLVCSLTILITIVPFYTIEQTTLSNDKIFKKYFPYYAIVAFGISAYYIISSNFDEFVCLFFITAFFTLIQSWVWICKMPAKN